MLSGSQLLAVFIVISVTIASVRAALFCTDDDELCFSTVVNGSSMTFEIEYRVDGWAAVGIGKNMSDADVMMVFFVDDEAYVQDRYSTGYSLPALDDTQSFNVKSVSRQSGKKTFVFSRALLAVNSQDKTIEDRTMDMIWAYSIDPVSSANSLSRHSEFGQFQINLMQDEEIFGGSSVNGLFRVIHAAFMFLAWGILVPVGIFVARFLKVSMGDGWFRTHWGLMVAAVICSAVGFGLILAQESTPFRSLHGSLGLAVLILAVLQSFLGQYINLKFKPDRLRVPWHDRTHWWMGRINFLLALITMSLGTIAFSRIGNTLLIAYIVYIAVLVFAFVIGELKVGQVHHSDLAAASGDVETREVREGSQQFTSHIDFN